MTRKPPKKLLKLLFGKDPIPFNHALPLVPLCVAYGMGWDSTAMLIEMHKRGVRPDLITFADTGSEKPETYAYLPVIQQWLANVGFPPVTVVKLGSKKYSSLEENCLRNKTLPSLAFGKKGCSLKWKTAPQNRYRNNWESARQAWRMNIPVTVAIGYDAGPQDSKRAQKLCDDRRYRYWYPLREWGLDRNACKQTILGAGLPLPMKSACFFCPASKEHEIEWLVRTHPELADRIVAMEANAKDRLTSIEGLWRSVPGSMTGLINSKRNLPIVEAA